MDTRFLDDLRRALLTAERVQAHFAGVVGGPLDAMSAVAGADGGIDFNLDGGLIASGFQSLAICFRLFIQSGVLAESSLGSPGIDELRWLAPVRPGDTLHSEIEVLEVRPSNSKPDRGIARLKYQAVNQRGEAVLGFIVNHLLRRKPS